MVVGAAAADGAHRVVAGRGADGVGVDGEGGGEGGVGRDRHGARVLRVAVVPAHEVVAHGRGGRQGGRGALYVGAAAGDCSPRRVVRGGGDGEPGLGDAQLHVVDGCRRIVAVAVVVVPHEDHAVVASRGYLEGVECVLPRGLQVQLAFGKVLPACWRGGSEILRRRAEG